MFCSQLGIARSSNHLLVHFLPVENICNERQC